MNRIGGISLEQDSMLTSINFIDKDISHNKGHVVFINNMLTLDNELLIMDHQYHGLISKTIQNNLLFSGEIGEVRVLNSISKDGELKYLILVGIGDEAVLKSASIEKLGAKIIEAGINHKISSIAIRLFRDFGTHKSAAIAALLASGCLLRSYRFDKYKTKETAIEKFEVDSLDISLEDHQEASEIFVVKKLVAEGVFFARDISNEPANVKTPLSYSEKIIESLEPLGVEVNVIGEREMNNLGMHALLGVGQGSQNESKLVVMEYRGLDDDSVPIAFVGKGVTFDTGGISIKPSANMEDMKYDMSGSAAVVGAIMALAARKAKVNLVGVVGLVENMPSGNAQRPGDVVTTMSGQTVEVLNTDAEGRLVLADAIWYVQEKFNPRFIVDLATLTGAIVVALGHTYAGCYSNDKNFAAKLIEAGDEVNEKLWHMPLDKEFDKMINSDIADIANIGNVPRAAGSSTAAHFIQRFIKEGVSWVHLDIAGVSDNKKGSSLGPKGSVGYGVRLLHQLIQDNYEQ